MKKLNKIAFGFGTLAVTALPVAAVVSCGGSDASASFWNYSDYISDDANESISSSYSYSEFGDLPDFERAIINKQAIGGVSSDYYIVKMANDGLIQPINFNEVFAGITTNVGGSDVTFGALEGDALKNAVKSLYTQQVWDLMASFDDQMDNGELWQYMVPYFLQNKVVAVNPFKVEPLTTDPNQATFINTLRGYDQTAIDLLFPDKTYKGILTTLKANGFDDLAINNYMRDNLMIGSETTGSSATIDNGIANIDKGKEYINGFQNTIDIFDDSKFIDSGFETLMALHSSSEKEIYDADTAFMYNGDALDAFQGYDQGEVEDLTHIAEIRTITPINSTYLLDGIVVPTYVTGDLLSQVNAAINVSFYKNANVVSEDQIITDEEINTFNMAYNNFNYVNYTTPFVEIYNDVITNYFADDLVGDNKTVNKNLTGSGAYASQIFKINGPIDADHITQPVDGELLEAVQTEYNRAFINN